MTRDIFSMTAGAGFASAAWAAYNGHTLTAVAAVVIGLIALGVSHA